MGWKARPCNFARFVVSFRMALLHIPVEAVGQLQDVWPWIGRQAIEVLRFACFLPKGQSHDSPKLLHAETLLRRPTTDAHGCCIVASERRLTRKRSVHQCSRSCYREYGFEIHCALLFRIGLVSRGFHSGSLSVIGRLPVLCVKRKPPQREPGRLGRLGGVGSVRRRRAPIQTPSAV